MLEKQIEQKVCDYCKKSGGSPYKFNSANRAAVPDRLIVRQGATIFIEFKRGGKKPTEAQKRELKKLYDQRIPVFVVDNVDHGKFIIDMMNLGVDMYTVSTDLRKDW